MLVEFIGASGAGKSFLSDLLYQELRAAGVLVRNFADLKVDRNSSKTLFGVLQAAYLSVRMRPKSLSLIPSTILTIASYSIRRQICYGCKDLHITSEGLFHHIITFQRNSRSLSMVQIASLLFDRIEPPDVVVMLEVSAETANARRTKRNRADDVFSLGSCALDVKAVQDALEMISQIRQTRQPAMLVLRVNGEEAGQDSVSKIVGALADLGCEPSSFSLASPSL